MKRTHSVACKDDRPLDGNLDLSLFSPLTTFEFFPSALLSVGDWNVFEIWRQVSKSTRACAIAAMRGLLRPRYLALVAALKEWLPQPFDTPFTFPSPGGPLALQWVPLVSSGNRNAVRPPGALVSEKMMSRSLMVWAISLGLFTDEQLPLVNIPEALARAGEGSYKNKVYFEPAFDFFSLSAEEQKKDNPAYFKKWQYASEHTVPALLSTLTVWRYSTGYNMGAPGNHQRFLKALLKQTWPNREDIPQAVAFLLFWAQHTTFETHVTDDTFLQSAIYLLCIELIFEWRRVKSHVYQSNPPIYKDMELLSIEFVSYEFFKLWFIPNPTQYNYYNPKALRNGNKRPLSEQMEWESEQYEEQCAKLRAEIPTEYLTNY